MGDVDQQQLFFWPQIAQLTMQCGGGDVVTIQEPFLGTPLHWTFVHVVTMQEPFLGATLHWTFVDVVTMQEPFLGAPLHWTFMPVDALAL